jgi:hypothetical protein
VRERSKYVGLVVAGASTEGQVLCWFLDAGNKEAPQAQLTGVQKATRKLWKRQRGHMRLAGPWRMKFGSEGDDQ